MNKLIIALFTISLFCNFGRVEYSALNPKAKTIQTDSTVRVVAANPSKVVPSELPAEQDSLEASEESTGWANYVALGIKTFFATLLKILVA
ncbi:hypothetical protein [Aquirufa antheringensis]|uniref:Uncharacterized protein n=1 Tax=Aquirufa antheringensis TaxID=2516559 RepID=A0A4Q9BBK1_9BACT|nr:hypothetical protein [Aquirufa antheringensis]MCZ2483999.1 hypothetical protein [Aquirufa antheringensis]TBH73011.1 hypothetical protein EWU20_06450 [Aquirufa antheringensis]